MNCPNIGFCEELRIFLDDYEDVLKNINKSNNTIDSYKSTICSFINFLEQHDKKIDFKKITPNLIVRFFSYKNKISDRHKEIKASTKKLYVVHLNYFFKFIEEESDELLDFDKVFKSSRLKISVPERLPKGIEKDSLDIIEIYLKMRIEKSKSYKESKQLVAFRDSMIFKMYLYTGIRESEIINLKLSDFKLDDGNLYSIKLIGKGNKEGVVFLDREKIEEEYNYYLKNGIENIAFTTRGTLLDRVQIWRICKRIYQGAGLKDLSGVHVLRHTFAKKIYEKTKDLVTVQALLRQKNIQTARIYAHQSESTIKKNYNEAIKSDVEIQYKKRVNQLSELGLSFNLKAYSYVYEDIDIGIVDIKSLTDQEWSKLLEQLEERS